MKKLLKIFSWLVLSIIGLVIILMIIAKLAENKIATIALEKVSESIEAPVDIDKVSFTLLRKFPLATIELNDVLLGSPTIQSNSDSITLTCDTILKINKIYVSVKSKPLLRGDIEIVKIDIDGANIKFKIDTNGITNIDFLMSSSDTLKLDTIPSEPLNLTLTDLTLKNVVCNFVDSSIKAKAKVLIPELNVVDLKMKDENIEAAVKGNISLSDCNFEGTNLHFMKNTDVDFDVDYENDSLNIKQLDIKTDGAKLNCAGNIILGEEFKTDITLQATELILNELVKYAPQEILNEYGLNKISGGLNIDAKVKGSYSDTEMPHVDLNIHLQDGNIITKDYPELKNIAFNGNITNGVLRNNQSTQAKFDSFHFETAESKFDIAFSVLDIDHLKYDVNANMDINVYEFSDFVPDSLIQNMNGNIKAMISTKGELPDSIGDDFVDYVMANTKAKVQIADFNVDMEPDISIKNFATVLTYKPNNFSVSNLNIDIPTYNFGLQNTSLNTDFYGSINNTSELSLNVKSYFIKTKGAEISGSVKVKNLDKPSYDMETKIAFNLEETKSLLPDSLLSDLSGSIIVDIKSKATLNLDSIAEQAIYVAFNKSTVHVDMNNITAVLPDDPMYNVKNLSGIIHMNPEAVTINKMTGIAAGLSFEIDSTEVLNSYETFVQGSKNEIFTVQTNIILGEINNSLLAAFMPTDTNSVENSELQSKEEIASTENVESTDSIVPKYLLPDLSEFGLPHFLIRGKLAINKVEYEKNIIDDISMNFRFADSLYVIDQFKLSTCDGDLNTSLKLDARNWDKPVVDLKSYISNLDVKKLLMLNDNFGDTLLTYEKVNGILTSELHVRAFYENGDWPTNKVKAQGDFTLEEGSIHGYEPLVALSKNKIVGGLKELDELDFNTLKTKIFLRKDKIYIPKTDIVTSSMDITAFAMQSLQDDYEYHLKLNLGDVLTGKSEKIMKEQAKQNKADGSTVERNGIKLVSMKYGDDKKNGFDNDKLEEKFKRNLNKQHGFLRLSFNPLLVNFSTDLDRTKRNKELIEKYGKKSEGN